MWPSWARAAARRGRADRPAGAGAPRSAPLSPDQLARRLHWPLLRPLAAHLGGDERSRVRGPGLELAEIREYQPGDDARHIDWNTTARADRPYVREAYSERALDAWLLVDLSASIDWGTARCLKRDRAVELAVVAGQLLGRHGNRVGALLFAERPFAVIPPAAGRMQLLRLIDRLRSEPRRGGAGPTDLAAAFVRAHALIRRRSFIMVVSDFLAPEGWQRPLGQLASRHEVVAARLADPREADIPDIGVVTLEDPETGAQLTIDTTSRRLRERFRAAAAARLERLDAELARLGVDRLALDTDQDLLPPLVRFLRARRRRRVTHIVGAFR